MWSTALQGIHKEINPSRDDFFLRKYMFVFHNYSQTLERIRLLNFNPKVEKNLHMPHS